ncbi:hypothetical protein EVAR_16633_1 [Eumeta japonica]|uniref:Uncharacterized protein n=1 Tax=Eumeta variegata TaxID=151549 RepID=A0A4C1V049_EUMVA|nr:hypothetical protein EVAR_16633_1 [Eumeta japonica]
MHDFRVGRPPARNAAALPALVRTARHRSECAGGGECARRLRSARIRPFHEKRTNFFLEDKSSTTRKLSINDFFFRHSIVFHHRRRAAGQVPGRTPSGHVRALSAVSSSTVIDEQPPPQLWVSLQTAPPTASYGLDSSCPIKMVARLFTTVHRIAAPLDERSNYNFFIQLLKHTYGDPSLHTHAHLVLVKYPYGHVTSSSDSYTNTSSLTKSIVSTVNAGPAVRFRTADPAAGRSAPRAPFPRVCLTEIFLPASWRRLFYGGRKKERYGHESRSSMERFLWSPSTIGRRSAVSAGPVSSRPARTCRSNIVRFVACLYNGVSKFNKCYIN